MIHNTSTKQWQKERREIYEENRTETYTAPLADGSSTDDIYVCSSSSRYSLDM